MSESELIKEEGDLKLTLHRDEYPDEPYDDGQCPIVRIERGRGGGSAEHVMIGDRPTDHDARIEEALGYFGSDTHLFEKYLRAFYGTTKIIQYGPNQSTDYAYFAYDTEEWIKSIGFDDKIAPRSKYDAKLSVNMNEWIAYLEGEVYTYDIERRVNVHQERTTTRMDGTLVSTVESDFASYEHVDSCGGYYGYNFAREAALEALEHQKG